MIYTGDCLAWLTEQEDDSIDLLFGSPPYERARTYGIDFDLADQAWVDWMVEIVKAAAPKVKGLIAINCQGQTRNYSYSGVPWLLFVDLKRAGFNMRNPPIFHRVGIPGSGGPDWLRGDYEPIICITRPGKLPWSDNTACGHPPKWAPGGDMSHRLSDGTKRNQWGASSKSTGGERGRDGVLKHIKPKPSHRFHTKREANGEMLTQGYNVPSLANPGNTIQRNYTADEVAAMVKHASDMVHCKVGGGMMGSPLAHENEAPFPLELPEFFVLSFCPPGGLVADPWCGSGTTGHAALLHGRRFIGCDIRQSQVDLTRRRLASVTPLLTEVVS